MRYLLEAMPQLKSGNALALVESGAENEVIIARNGRPAARLVAFASRLADYGRAVEVYQSRSNSFAQRRFSRLFQAPRW